MNYTPDQLRRRNESKWTTVQAVGAPIQMLIFFGSLFFVARYLSTGLGFDVAHGVSLAKVAMMTFMTVTGMFWEHDVYGKYFMAKEFFWEDFVNAVSLTFHLAFIGAWLVGLGPAAQMSIMLIALLTYCVNFAQFLYRGVRAGRQRRAARRNPPEDTSLIAPAN